MTQEQFEDATPDPEFLIKSIAEQGYSLETALADLIDNSISAEATHIEILIDTTIEPFTLFLADDGSGMSEGDLKRCMQFPSSSPEVARKPVDLGRFGLGLKTASFSQTRHLTVISKKPGEQNFNGRSWNVNTLSNKQWKIKIETNTEIHQILSRYQELSRGFMNEFSGFTPNTVVVWRGLYKFESYLSEADRGKELKRQITDVTSQYLSLVFHRFFERKTRAISIRVNNILISPFNPFPPDQIDLRKLDSNRKQFQSDNLRIEGYILPSRSLEESREDGSIWVQKGKSLTDMEGMYIYRGNRIIVHGGWNGIIKKNPRLQLARLKVDIGNSVDNFFHLNVAKSSVTIPPDLRIAFMRYVSDLRHEAEKEYFNRGLKRISVTKDRIKANLFVRIPSEKGMLLKVNEEFPLLKTLISELSESQISRFAMILRMVDTTINKVRQVHEDKDFVQITEDSAFNIDAVLDAIAVLQRNGISNDDIRENFLAALGIRRDSVPDMVAQLLNK